jgi:hypothetical protein
MGKALLILLILFVPVLVNAQWGENINKKIGDYTFVTNNDTSDYSVSLTISKDGKQIYKDTFLDLIEDIKQVQLEAGGKKYIFIDFFSGGAHCCSSLLVGELRGDKFLRLDSTVYGNSGYNIEDIDKDGVKEIISGNDMFAYAFTNYSETRFPIRIQRIRYDKIKDFTEDFEDVVLKEIAEFKKDLDDVVKEGFECPSTEDEDTFNTDAGSVKTVLAAIVADYYSIGKVEKGYDLVNKVYKCSDKNKFVKILKEDFKLK